MSIELQKIEQILSQHNYDLRITNEGRWIDQKCTPDVISFICECILELPESLLNKSFKVKDIWMSDYFNQNVQAIFTKPDALNKTASSEYDKFIQQPLRLLAYSKLLNIQKNGNSNEYSINYRDVLEYLAIKDRFSYNFLLVYIKKVLSDSGIYSHFQTFINKGIKKVLSKNDFYELKSMYEKFIIENTPINTEVEVRRIFTKVLNPLSVEFQIQGTVRGYLSKNKIQFSELMYNQENWRDILNDKSKSMTRSEFNELIGNTVKLDYSKYLVTKMKNLIRRKYTHSEILPQYDLDTNRATQIHHIFMESEFPQIAHYLENLIALTPNQHNLKAHPNNNTQYVDKDFQCICLLSKSDSIQKSLDKDEEFYSKSKFIFVINTGLNSELDNDSNFDEIRHFISVSYNLI